jgi:hypothetical protein
MDRYLLRLLCAGMRRIERGQLPVPIPVDSLQGVAGMSLAALMRNRPRIVDDARFAPTATADLSLIDVDPGKLHVRGMTRRHINSQNANQPRDNHPLASWMS